MGYGPPREAPGPLAQGPILPIRYGENGPSQGPYGLAQGLGPLARGWASPAQALARACFT